MFLIRWGSATTEASYTNCNSLWPSLGAVPSSIKATLASLRTFSSSSPSFSHHDDAIDLTTCDGDTSVAQQNNHRSSNNNNGGIPPRFTFMAHWEQQQHQQQTTLQLQQQEQNKVDSATRSCVNRKKTKNQKQKQQRQASTTTTIPTANASPASSSNSKKIPRGFWRDMGNRRSFFEWASQQLGIQHLDGWYNVSVVDVQRLGGMGILQRYYNNSLQQALAAMYPHHEWLPWKFRAVPMGFWEDPANHRRFFDWAAQRLGIREFDGWYGVIREDVEKLGGSGLLQRYYNNSLQHALSSVYPEHEWLPWRFAVVPLGFWDDRANHRWFMDWTARQLNLKHLDDWYGVTVEDIHRLGGRGLLNGRYNHSLRQALAAVYPEHEWLPWRFSQVPAGFWDDIANQRRFFDWCAAQLGILQHHRDRDHDSDAPQPQPQPHEGWYAVSKEDIYVLGGESLVHERYRGSLIRALAAVYPEYQWDPWRFQRCAFPKDELVDAGAMRRFVEGTLAPAMHVAKLEDWYRVSVEKARNTVDGYRAVIDRHGGLAAVLKRVYPEHEWDERKLMRSSDKRSSQRVLRIATQQILPGEDVVEEYAHPGLRFQDSDAPITFDIWVPSLSLALEYHGEQHYRDVYVLGNNSSLQRERDDEKAEACRRARITLVAVPYWWRDKCSAEDLAATIAAARPDLLVGGAYPTLAEAAQKGTAWCQRENKYK